MHSEFNLRTYFAIKPIILCESLYNMYVFDCGVSARGKPRGAKGIRGQQPCDHGFRDWFSADVTSASLPLPSSSPLSPSHSLPLSASLSLCTALLFSPLPFLSIPPLRDGVCRCCSGVRGLTCTQRGPPPHPPICCIFLGCLFSLCPPPLLLPFSSPPTQPPCAGVWELGPWGWRESRTCFAWELYRISYALPRHPLTGRISSFLSACTPEDNIG